jgi:predicted RecA/RadA family phage recombinase
MKNYLETGDTVVVTAPEAVDSGEFIVKGALYGVAAGAADIGSDVVLKRFGVFELPKATGAAWVQGDRLYWDAGAKNFTKAAGTNQPIGVAFSAAAIGDVVGEVLLDPNTGGFKVAAGQIATATAADTVVTGLGTVVSAVATLDSDLGDDPEWVSCSIGDQAGAPAAGSIIIKTWKNTAGNDPTPTAAATFSKKVNWIAFGI